MFLHNFRYFKLFILVFTMIFISTSCQPPNIKEPKKEDKPQVIITDKKKELKSFSTKAIVKHLEEFSSEKIYGFSYDREVYNRTSFINLLQAGGADPNFYLIDDNTSTSKENGSFSIRYVSEEKKWVIGLLNRYFDLPADGGSYTYTTPSENGGYYTETYNFTLSVSDSDITIKISGKSVLSPSYSTGPYSFPTCQGVDFSIHTGFCYYHYSSIQTDTYNSTIKIDLRTSVLTLSVNPTEINDTNTSSEIKVSSSDDTPWQLEITKKDNPSDCMYKSQSRNGVGDQSFPFDGKAQGDYEIKAYYVDYPAEIEKATLTVKNSFDLSISPETVLLVGQKASLKIKAKNRSWSLETKEPSTNPTPDPSSSPVPLSDNGDLTIEKTFDKVGDYTFTLTPKSCSETVNAITKTVKVVLVAPTPTPSPSPSDSCYPGKTIPGQFDMNGNPSCCPEGAVCSGGQDVTPSDPNETPIDIILSPTPSTSPTVEPTPTSTPTPTPTPTVTPTPSISPSPDPSGKIKGHLEIGVNAYVRNIPVLDDPFKYGSFSIKSTKDTIFTFFPNGLLYDGYPYECDFTVALRNVNKKESLLSSPGKMFIYDNNNNMINQGSFTSEILVPEQIIVKNVISWGPNKKLSAGIYTVKVVPDNSNPATVDVTVGPKQFNFEVDTRSLADAKKIQSISITINSMTKEKLNHIINRHGFDLLGYKVTGNPTSPTNPYVINTIDAANFINDNAYKIAMGQFANEKVYYYISKYTNPTTKIQIEFSVVRNAFTGDLVSIFTKQDTTTYLEPIVRSLNAAWLIK